MLITFKGRKSGRAYTTPVRYIVDGTTGNIRCFTSSENQWWKNCRGGVVVTLRIKGVENRYRTTVIENNPLAVAEALRHYLALFPQDAAYHNIKLNKDKSLDSDGLERASREAVIVDAVVDAVC